jgi:hypothetical protein
LQFPLFLPFIPLSFTFSLRERVRWKTGYRLVCAAGKLGTVWWLVTAVGGPAKEKM